MKKMGAIGLIMFLVLAMKIHCFADDQVIYSQDFENEIEDQAPQSVYALGEAPPSIEDLVVKTQEGQKCVDILRSKYMTCVFDEEIANGVFVIEYESYQASAGPLIVSLLNTDNYNVSVSSAGCQRAIAYTAGSKIQTFTSRGTNESFRYDFVDAEGNGIGFSADRWNKVRLTVNIDAQTMQLSINGVDSMVVEGYTYLGEQPIKGISFYNGGGVGAERFIDNIRVYFPDNTPEVSYIDYLGNDGYTQDNVPAIIETIKLTYKFSISENVPADACEAVVIEDGQGNVIPHTGEISADRQSVMIYPEANSLAEYTDYTVSIPGDVFLQREDVCFSFTTGEKSETFVILDMGLENDSGEIENPESGESGYLWVEYLKIGDLPAKKGVLACTTETDGVLSAIELNEFTFDGNGRITYRTPIRLTTEAFDKVYIYLWDGDTFVPMEKYRVKETGQ